MEWYEIESVLDYSWYKNKESWEQARLAAYMTAQVNSRDKLEFQDVIRFPWESESEEVESAEDIAAIRESIKNIKY